MKELLKHYAEKMNQLSADYAMLRINEAVAEYNRLRNLEYLTYEENKLLAEANNQIIKWNIHVNTIIDIYYSLKKKDNNRNIPSPEKYFIKGFTIE